MPDANAPDGIKNETQMEPSDDSEWIINHFEDFLKARKDDDPPFLVQIWLHVRTLCIFVLVIPALGCSRSIFGNSILA
jgi:hypothetical protein